MGLGEFRRGWKVVLAASLGVGTGLSPIPFYTIGAFVRPLSSAFGWTVDQILAALIFANASMLIGSPVVGLLSDRYGVRPIALTSMVLFALSLILFAANPGSLPVFYANYVLLALVGSGTLPITWTRAVNSWFKESRGLALGLTFFSTGLFGSLAKLAAAWLIGTAGWRAGYAGLAVFPIVLAFPVALAFFREREPSPRRAGASRTSDAVAESGMALREALTTRRFWTMAAAVVMVTSTAGGAMPNLEPLLVSKGFEAKTAVELASLIGVAVLIGRPLGGWLIDRFWAPGVAFIILVAPVASFLIFGHVALTAPLAGLCVLLIGFALGLEYDVIAYMVSRYFGMRAYGAIYGCLYALFALAAAVGAYVIGHAFTRHNSYDAILDGCAVVMLVGATLLLTLGPYPGASSATPKAVVT